jgi:hypothetical protein
MKTNFLNKLKQGLFLLIAILGTFVGFSQSTQNPTIGGKNTPGDIGGLLDIGGGKSSDGGLGQLIANVQLIATTQCVFAYLGDTGGGSKGTSTDTGQMDDDDFDIGGRSDTGTGGFFPIAFDTGGKGGRGMSTGGDIDSPDDYDDYDTGGGRGANTNTGDYMFADIGGRSDDTGGKSSTGGMETNDIGGRSTGGDWTPMDIGGQKGQSGEFTITDTGGRDTGGGLNPLNDLGGRGGSDTGTGPFAFSDIGGRGTGTDSGTGQIIIFDTGGRTPGGIGYTDSKLLKIEQYGCILRPDFLTE